MRITKYLIDFQIRNDNSLFAISILRKIHGTQQVIKFTIPQLGDKRRNNLVVMCNISDISCISERYSIYCPHKNFILVNLFLFEAEYLRNGTGSWKVSKLTSLQGRGENHQDAKAPRR